MVVQEPDRRAELTTNKELQKELKKRAGMAAAAGGQKMKMAGVHYQMGFGSGARASFRRKKAKGKGGLSHGTQIEVDQVDSAKSKADGDWEFDRAELFDLKQIGQGNFGVVYLGRARGIIATEPETAVAVKTLSSTDKAAEAEFMAEAKIMKSMADCNKIVQLLGLCTKGAPKYMIMEYMSKGDLKEVLRTVKPRGGRPAEISHRRMCLMGQDIAEAFSFLGKRTIVHRDLATRNCLVGEGYEVKVGDFGLTRKTYTSEYYRMKHSAPLPIRWMAIESLMDGLFTSSSDLWSFGIVLWEIASFGKLPYMELENIDVVDAVCENDFRLPAPPACPAGMHAIMLECWEEEPEDRGSFADKLEALRALATKASDDPITRETYRGQSGSNGGGNHDDDDDEDADGGDGAAGYELPGGAELGGVVQPEPAYVVQPEGAYDAVPGRAPDPNPYGLTTPVTVTLDVDSGAAAVWITEITGTKIDPSNLHRDLRDGKVLCTLANKLAGSSKRKVKTPLIRKIHGSRNGLKQKENVANFLDAIMELGVGPHDLFEVNDLYADEDMMAVVLCIDALRRAVQD